MTGTNELLNVITFCCPACQARLTVPLHLAGIEGPCPSCYHAIRAPEQPVMASPPQVWPPAPSPAPIAPPPAAVEAAPALRAPAVESRAPSWDDTTPIMLPVFPPNAAPALETVPAVLEAIVAPAFNAGNFNELMDMGAEKGFKARLAIRPPEDLDESWKSRHRDQQKGRRRVRRAERAAQNFLDSNAFRLARAALIVLSGAMLTWLFLHLKENRWSFGAGQPVAKDTPARPAVPPMKNQPPAAPARTMQADDETEIPAAADIIPANSASPATTNIAVPPR